MSSYHTLTFNKGCHGFKLSPVFRNRLYYYHKGEWDMDMGVTPSGRWIIKWVCDIDTKTFVILKNIK